MINVQLGEYTGFTYTLGVRSNFVCGLVLTPSGGYRLTDENGIRLDDANQARESDNG